MTIRNLFLAIPLLVLFSTFSYSAVKLNAAADNGQKTGSVSLSHHAVSPDHAKSQRDTLCQTAPGK
ncbi:MULTISPECIES: hypothetical protein [Serratia]|jgi:hypothetical protein|uniref:hypothetical protein n=1 Tax=Serratia TaxID=613 RepID=UPI001AE6E56C|nr:MULTISPECIES: hypothetical protein [Serratia]MBP1128582.1 hypothetical protein [Serratia sp. PL17]